MSTVITLVAARDAMSLTPAHIETARMAAGGGTKIVWLSAGEAAEFHVFGAPDLTTIRAALGAAPIDVMATRARGRRRGVLVADMDSTIVQNETLDDLAEEAGLGPAVAAITRRSMNGEIDFATALRERVAMLRGLPLSALEQTLTRTRLTSGAQTLVATMHAHGALTALVSGGFTFFTSRIAASCGFDHHRANTLQDDGTALTGKVGDPILGREAKLAALQEFAAIRGVAMRATLAVGDGANDLDMLGAAGLGVAFHAKPIVAARVPVQVTHTDLHSLLFLQGYPRSVFTLPG